MSNQKYFEMFDDYLDGKLASVSKEDIEQALKQDPSLKTELQLHIQARAEIRSAAEHELKAKFQSKLKASPKIQEKKSGMGKSSLLLGLLLLGLLFGAYYLWNAQTSQDAIIPMASIEDPSYDLFRSNQAQNLEELWQKSVGLFSEKKYRTALETLKPLEENGEFLNSHHGKFHLLKGVAQMRLEDFTQAINQFSSIDKENPFRDQAEWYLALSYFYDGQKKEALQAFQNIQKDEFHFKKEDAEKFLKHLR